MKRLGAAAASVAGAHEKLEARARLSHDSPMIKFILGFFLVWPALDLLLGSWSSRAHATAPAQTLSIQRIFESPELDGGVLINLQFSPRGERLTFLKPKQNDYEVLDLWEYDLKTGEPHLLVDSKSLKFGQLSEEEKARRERMRQSRKGIVEYKWFHDGQRIVFPAAGDLYLYSLSEKKLTKLTDDKAAELDVKPSPRDGYVSYVSSQNLFVLDVRTGKAHAVSEDGKGPISYGSAEFIAQEEMGRTTGYWWSKDEKRLAFTRVDESAVQVVDRYDIDAEKVIARQERYPQAGSENALVQLAVANLEDILQRRPNVQWIDLGKNKDIYLANAAWNSDGHLVYLIQSRDQKRLSVFSYDPAARKNRKLFEETDSKWIDLHKDVRMLEKSSRWIWASERSGFKHLYLYSNDGALLRPLTKGPWPVDYLAGVDEERGWVYFASGAKSPLERQIYRVPLEKPGEPQLLTALEGWNDAAMSEKADVFVHTFSAPLTPPQTHLRRADGEWIAALSPNEVKQGHPLFPFKASLIAPEFGSFKGASGEPLYLRIYKPRGFEPRKKYPLIVTGYGGPTAQVVSKSWGGKGGLFAQVLADKGFVVASVDNRGSARRGKKFANYLYRAFGTVEVEDQVGLVRHLTAQGFVDPARVGFFGWSYGGFLALSLATKAPSSFKALVAGAPVTDFALYDTHYTERYLGDPRRDLAAYKRANVLPLVGKIEGTVLAIHGMADDNVLFSNSTMLFKEMQKAGKVYESVVYPGAKHGLYGKDNQIHLNKTILDFFERRLK